MAGLLDDLAASVAGYINKTFGKQLAVIGPQLKKLRDWVNANTEAMRGVEVFAQMAMKFAEMARDLPFGEEIYSAVQLVSKYALDQKSAVDVINKLADVPEKLTNVDAIYDLVFGVLNAAGIDKGGTSSKRLLTAVEDARSHRRRLRDADDDGAVDLDAQAAKLYAQYEASRRRGRGSGGRGLPAIDGAGDPAFRLAQPIQRGPRHLGASASASERGSMADSGGAAAVEGGPRESPARRRSRPRFSDLERTPVDVPAPVNVRLGDLAQLRRSHRSYASVTDLAAALAQRGALANDTDAQLVRRHVPYADRLEHRAHHEGVGFIAANYSASLMPNVAMLDEFVALFKALNASWSCEVPAGFEPGGLFGSIIQFSFPAGASDRRANLALRYLTVRLGQPGSLLAWGDLLNEYHAAQPLWGPSCDTPLANRTTVPYFAIVNRTVRVSRTVGAATLAFVAGAAPPLMFFARLQGMNLQLLPDEAQALAAYPDAPVILANATVVSVARYVDAECGGNVSACSSEATASRLRQRRLQQYQQHVDTVSTTTAGNQQFGYHEFLGWNWNYDAGRNAAKTSPLQLLSHVDPKTLGCKDCYIHMSLGLRTSLDFCNPLSGVSCNADLPAGQGWGLQSVYLRELGAYVEGTIDMRATIVVDDPTLHIEDTLALLPEVNLGTVTLSVAGLPLSITALFKVDVAVKLDATVAARFNYSASFFEQLRGGAAYNYVAFPSDPLRAIVSFPAPSISVPAPDFSGLTSPSLSLDMTATFKPRVTLALYGIVPIYVALEAPLRLELTAGQGSCPWGIGATGLLSARARVGMGAITWETILQATGLASTTSLSTILSGEVIPGFASPWLNVLDNSVLFGPLCLTLPSATATSTASVTRSPGVSGTSTGSGTSSGTRTSTGASTGTRTSSSTSSRTRTPAGSRSTTPSLTLTPSRSGSVAPSIVASRSGTVSATRTASPSKSVSRNVNRVRNLMSSYLKDLYLLVKGKLLDALNDMLPGEVKGILSDLEGYIANMFKTQLHSVAAAVTERVSAVNKAIMPVQETIRMLMDHIDTVFTYTTDISKTTERLLEPLLAKSTAVITESPAWASFNGFLGDVNGVLGSAQGLVSAALNPAQMLQQLAAFPELKPALDAVTRYEPVASGLSDIISRASAVSASNSSDDMASFIATLNGIDFVGLLSSALGAVGVPGTSPINDTSALAAAAASLAVDASMLRNVDGAVTLLAQLSSALGMRRDFAGASTDVRGAFQTVANGLGAATSVFDVLTNLVPKLTHMAAPSSRPGGASSSVDASAIAATIIDLVTSVSTVSDCVGVLRGTLTAQFLSSFSPVAAVSASAQTLTLAALSAPAGFASTLEGSVASANTLLSRLGPLFTMFDGNISVLAGLPSTSPLPEATYIAAAGIAVSLRALAVQLTAQQALFEASVSAGAVILGDIQALLSSVPSLNKMLASTKAASAALFAAGVSSIHVGIFDSLNDVTTLFNLLYEVPLLAAQLPSPALFGAGMGTLRTAVASLRAFSASFYAPPSQLGAGSLEQVTTSLTAALPTVSGVRAALVSMSARISSLLGVVARLADAIDAGLNAGLLPTARDIAPTVAVLQSAQSTASCLLGVCGDASQALSSLPAPAQLAWRTGFLFSNTLLLCTSVELVAPPGSANAIDVVDAALSAAKFVAIGVQDVIAAFGGASSTSTSYADLGVGSLQEAMALAARMTAALKSAGGSAALAKTVSELVTGFSSLMSRGSDVFSTAQSLMTGLQSTLNARAIVATADFPIPGGIAVASAALQNTLKTLASLGATLSRVSRSHSRGSAWSSLSVDETIDVTVAFVSAARQLADTFTASQLFTPLKALHDALGDGITTPFALLTPIKDALSSLDSGVLNAVASLQAFFAAAQSIPLAAYLVASAGVNVVAVQAAIGSMQAVLRPVSSISVALGGYTADSLESVDSTVSALLALEPTLLDVLAAASSVTRVLDLFQVAPQQVVQLSARAGALDAHAVRRAIEAVQATALGLSTALVYEVPPVAQISNVAARASDASAGLAAAFSAIVRVQEAAKSVDAALRACAVTCPSLSTCDANPALSALASSVETALGTLRGSSGLAALRSLVSDVGASRELLTRAAEFGEVVVRATQVTSDSARASIIAAHTLLTHASRAVPGVRGVSHFATSLDALASAVDFARTLDAAAAGAASTTSKLRQLSNAPSVVAAAGVIGAAEALLARVRSGLDQACALDADALAADVALVANASASALDLSILVDAVAAANELGGRARALAAAAAQIPNAAAFEAVHVVVALNGVAAVLATAALPVSWTPDDVAAIMKMARVGPSTIRAAGTAVAAASDFLALLARDVPGVAAASVVASRRSSAPIPPGSSAAWDALQSQIGDSSRSLLRAVLTLRQCAAGYAVQAAAVQSASIAAAGLNASVAALGPLFGFVAGYLDPSGVAALLQLRALSVETNAAARSVASGVSGGIEHSRAMWSQIVNSKFVRAKVDDTTAPITAGLAALSGISLSLEGAAVAIGHIYVTLADSVVSTLQSVSLIASGAASLSASLESARSLLTECTSGSTVDMNAVQSLIDVSRLAIARAVTAAGAPALAQSALDSALAALASIGSSAASVAALLPTVTAATGSGSAEAMLRATGFLDSALSIAPLALLAFEPVGLTPSALAALGSLKSTVESSRGGALGALATLQSLDKGSVLLSTLAGLSDDFTAVTQASASFVGAAQALPVAAEAITTMMTLTSALTSARTQLATSLSALQSVSGSALATQARSTCTSLSTSVGSSLQSAASDVTSLSTGLVALSRFDIIAVGASIARIAGALNAAAGTQDLHVLVSAVAPIAIALTAIPPARIALGYSAEDITAALNVLNASLTTALRVGFPSTLTPATVGRVSALYGSVQALFASLTTTQGRFMSVLSFCGSLDDATSTSSLIDAGVFAPLSMILYDVDRALSIASDAGSLLSTDLSNAGALLSSLESCASVAGAYARGNVTARLPASLLRLRDVGVRALGLVSSISAEAEPVSFAIAVQSAWARIDAVLPDLSSAEISFALQASQQAYAMLSSAGGLHAALFAGGGAQQMLATLATSTRALNVGQQLLGELGMDLSSALAAHGASQRLISSAHSFLTLTGNFSTDRLQHLLASFMGLNESLPAMRELAAELARLVNDTAPSLTSGSPALTFSAISALAMTVKSVLARVQDIQGQANSLVDFEALSSQLSDAVGLGDVARDAQIVVTAISDAALAVANAPTASKPSLFAPLLKPLKLPTALEGALGFLPSLWSSLSGAATVHSTMGSMSSLEPVLGGFASVASILSDFASLDSALDGIPMVGEAKASLDAALTLVSQLGRTLAGSVRDGPAGLERIASSVRVAVGGISSAAIASLDRALPSTSVVTDGLHLLGQVGPEALQVADALAGLLAAVPPAGDSVAVTSRPGINLPSSLSAGDFAAVSKLLRGVPTALIDRIGGVCVQLSELLAALPAATQVASAGQGIRMRIGASDAELATGDLMLRALGFGSASGVAAITAGVSSRLVSGLEVAFLVLGNASTVLSSRAAGVAVANSTALAALQLTEAFAQDTLLQAMSDASSLLSDVQAVVASLGDTSTLLSSLSSFGPAAAISVADVSALTKLRVAFQSVLALPLVSVSGAADAVAALNLVEAVIPIAKRTATYVAGPAASAVALLTGSGPLATLASAQATLLTARQITAGAIDALRAVVFPPAPTVTTVTSAALASAAAALDTVRALVGALLTVCRNQTAVSTSVEALSELSRVLVDSATTLVRLKGRANLVPAIASASAAISGLRASVPSSIANVLTTVDDMSGLARTLVDAGELFWALRRANLADAAAALESWSARCTAAAALAPAVVQIDTLYKIVLSYNSGFDLASVGRADVSSNLAYTTSTGQQDIAAVIVAAAADTQHTENLLLRVLTDIAARANGDVSQAEERAILSLVAPLLTNMTESSTRLLTATGGVTTLMSTFYSAGLADVQAAFASVLQALRGVTAADSTSLSLSFAGALAFTRKLRALESLELLSGELDGVIAVAERATSALATLQDLAAVLNASATILAPDVSQLLVMTSRSSSYTSGLLMALQKAAAFYRDPVTRTSPDAAATLLNDLSRSVTLLAVSRPFAPLVAPGGLTRMLTAVTGFALAADAVARVRFTLQLDDALVLASTAASAANLRRVTAVAVASLARLGVPTSAVQDIPIMFMGDTQALYNTFTRLPGFNVNGALTSVASSLEALGQPDLRAAAIVLSAVAGRLSALPRAYSLDGVAALQSSAINQLTAAASAAAEAFTEISLSTQFAISDLDARFATGLSYSTSAVVQGRLVLILQEASRLVSMTQAALRAPVKGVCDVGSALQSSSAVGIATAGVTSALTGLTQEVEATVTLLSEALRFAGDVPALLTQLPGAPTARITLQAALGFVRRARAVLSVVTLDSTAIAAAQMALVELCGPPSGALATLDNLSAALDSALAAYRNSSGASASIPTPGSLSMRLTTALVPLGSLKALLSGSDALGAVMATLRSLASAATMIAGLSTDAPAVASVQSASAFSSDMASRAVALLGSVIGDVHSDVTSFFSAINGGRAVAAAVGWMGGAYGTFSSTASVTAMRCQMAAWFGGVIPAVCGAPATTPAPTRSPSAAVQAPGLSGSLQSAVNAFREFGDSLVDAFSQNETAGPAGTDVYAALDGVDAALVSLGNVSSTLAAIDALSHMRSVLIVGVQLIGPSLASDVDAVRQLVTRLQTQANTALPAAASIGGLTLDLGDTSQLDMFSLPNLDTISTSLLSLSSAASALAPLQSLADASAPPLDLSPALRLLRVLDAQASVVRLIRKLLPLLDVTSAATSALDDIQTTLAGVALDATGTSGVLASLSGFRKLLPRVTSMLSTVSNASGVAHASFTERAKGVISVVRSTIDEIGAGFALVSPSIERVKTLLTQLPALAQRGLSTLASQVRDALAALAALANDPDVLALGLGGSFRRVADTLSAASSAPKLLRAVSHLASAPLDAADMGAVSKLLGSVASLSGFTDALVTLDRMLAASLGVMQTIEDVQALVGVAGGASGLSRITSVLGDFGEGVAVIAEALRDVKSYLHSTTDDAATRAQTVVALLRQPFTALPSWEEGFSAINGLESVLKRVLTFGTNVTAPAIADLRTLISGLVNLTRGANGVPIGTLGIGVVVSGPSPGVTSSAALVMPSMESLHALVPSFPTAAGLVVPLRAALMSLKDLADQVETVVNAAGGLLGSFGGDSAAFMRSLGVDLSEPSALFDAGALVFGRLDSISSVFSTLRPLVDLLEAAPSVCPAPSPVATALSEPSSSEVVLVADALVCAALSAAERLTPGALQISLEGVTYDTTRCRGTAVDVARIFPGLGVVSDVAVLSSPSGLYARLAASLPVVALPSEGLSVLASSAPAPPLLGLGFCFTPSITTGPCALISASLSEALSTIATGIDVVQALSPLAAKSLSLALGPAIVGVTDMLHREVLPQASIFVGGVASFTAGMLNSLGVELVASTGGAARRLMHVDGAGAPSSLDAAELLPGVHHPRRTALLFSLAYDVLDGIERFTEEGEAEVHDLARTVLSTIPLDEVIAATDAIESVIAPVRRVMGLVNPFISKITDPGTGVDELVEYLQMGPVVQEVGNNIKPLVTFISSLFAWMKTGIAQALPAVRRVVNTVSTMYAQGKDIFNRFWNLDSWIEEKAREFLDIRTSGKTSAQLKPWQLLPWCSASVCLRQETRSDDKYRQVLFYLRYLQFYDLSSPPLVGSQPIMQWTIAGLYEWYRPRGVGFFKSFMMSCMSADKQEAAGKPSLLVFYPRGSRAVHKILELYVDATTPFTGSCGGVTHAKSYVYVTDDDGQEGYVLGFAAADIEAQLAAGSKPGRITVTSAQGRPLVFNTPFTASSIYWDADVLNPRLWISERMRNATKDEPALPAKSSLGRRQITLGWRNTNPPGAPAPSFALFRRLRDLNNTKRVAAAETGPRRLEFSQSEIDICGNFSAKNKNATKEEERMKLPAYCCDIPRFSNDWCAEKVHASATPSATMDAGAVALALQEQMERAQCTRMIKSAADLGISPKDREPLPVYCMQYELDYPVGAEEEEQLPPALANVALPPNAMDYAKLAGFKTSSTGLPSGWASGPAMVYADVEASIGAEAQAACYGYVEFPDGPKHIVVSRCRIKAGFDCKLEFVSAVLRKHEFNFLSPRWSVSHFLLVFPVRLPASPYPPHSAARNPRGRPGRAVPGDECDAPRPAADLQIGHRRRAQGQVGRQRGRNQRNEGLTPCRRRSHHASDGAARALRGDRPVDRAQPGGWRVCHADRPHGHRVLRLLAARPPHRLAVRPGL